MKDRNGKIIACMIAEQTVAAQRPKIVDYDRDTVTIYAEVQDCTEWNRNGRKYPFEVVVAGLQAENITEQVATNSLMGEADHPVNPTVQRQQTVLTVNASHRILRIDIDRQQQKIFALIKTMPTEQGRVMRDLILDPDYPLLAAFSLRAVGNVKRTPQGDVVVGPIRVITYDWVKYPSHRHAYQTKIMSEATAIVNENTVEDFCTPICESTAIDFLKKDKAYRVLGLQFDTSLNECNLDQPLALNDKIDNEICSFMSNSFGGDKLA